DEAEKLIFPYSRLYCDVERFRADRDELMAKNGMGVCYTRTSHGTELRKVSSKEKAFIKSTIYDKHHKKLDRLVERELRKDNCALIIDCHSFPNEIYAQHNQGDARPDICIGADSFHTSDALLSYVKEYFENEGFTVAINEPFSGTMVPLKYYKKDKRVQSIMIEVNRKLYLNETFRKNDNFGEIQELIHTLLKNINERHHLNHF
ncbi:MAG: N-formylglutamate amidohydrolase, partial [Epsilonproteobacteria bacterium]|nr:N-formylglutamate amidohydrolase [Campylobacterota bacterium]